jgi:hypothetical protein
MSYGFVFLLLVLTGFTFWISMIVDCVTNEPSTETNKVVWTAIVVFAYIAGAPIYYFVRRRPRRFAL